MSLPRRVGLVIFAMASFGAIVLAVASYLVSRDAVSVSIHQHQLDIAKQLMSSVDRLLFERRNDLSSMSQDSTLLSLILQPDNQDARLKAADRLKRLSQTTGSWDRLDVIDRSNVVLASTGDNAIGKINQDAAIVTVLHRAQGGEIAYSDVYYDEALGKPTMLFAAPVRQEKNASQPVVATVVGHLYWNQVVDLLGSIDDSEISLFNHAGIKIGSQDNPGSILKTDLSSHPAIQRAQKGASGTEEFNGLSKNEQTLVSFVHEDGYSAYKGNEWILTAETPTSVALAPANDATVKRIIVLIVVTVLGASASAWLVAAAIRPIIALTKSANRLSIGDLSHRFKVTSHDEIGQLGQALNNMADKLQQLYQGLESKVKEKTLRLGLRAEEAEANAAKDEAILSSIGEGLVVVNLDRRVTRINNHALRIFGLQLEAVLGKRIVDTVLFYGEKGDPLDDKDRPTETALSAGHQTEKLYQIQRPHGIKIVIAVVTTPVIIKQQIMGAIMVVRDVTKEREVDRMKTEFISLASHQLRTPLSAVKWFTEMLLAGDAGKLSDEQHEFAANVYESTQRMIELVNSLLNISRIESGRIIVDPKPTDIGEMLHGIVNDLQAKIEHKRQKLVVNVHKDLPKINLDPRLISQVYLNFLTNAIKYTPKDGQISVVVERKGNDLVSEITDTGYGIPQAQQNHIFQKFFRAENAIKVETDGTGLGLYLAKAIIESSGGKVWFTSAENKGTTFWFSLPMSGMKPKAGEVTLDI
jgi:PAS domain S-box-containing protein